MNNDDMTTGVDTMNNDDTFTGKYDNIEDTETATETQFDIIEHNIAPYTGNETENETNGTGHNQDNNNE